MDFADAKERIKQRYIDAGVAVTDEHDRELYLQTPDNLRFRVGEADILGFGEAEDARPTLVTAPTPCSIVSPDYREQLLQSLNPMRGFMSDLYYTFGDPDGVEPYAVVGPPSAVFVNYFRFESEFFEWSMRRVRSPMLDRNPDIYERLLRTPTIRVFNLSQGGINAAIDVSTQIIESTLFELTYLGRPPYWTADDFPFRRLRTASRGFEPTGRSRGTHFPFPAARFSADLIRFYQLGASSDVGVLQFLAFYQVLEYHFLAVSDERLYDKLKRRLVDPKFAVSAAHLDRVIHDVLNHSRESDETEMLKGVISKYVSEDELIEFIERYETHLGRKHYTAKRNLFGESVEVKSHPGHVIGNIAKTLKVVRNALVHSSDRYEREARHVPFSENTEIVDHEVPLVRFLAERVIIASAETL